MRANELRIGNWVIYRNQIVKTTGLHYDMFECGFPADENWMCTGRLSGVHPIELTEEVLLKIGFKKVFQSKITKGRFELNVDMGDNEFLNIVYHVYASGNTNLNITQRRCASLCDDSIDKSGIKYLHQLQNAYYLLTNEELEMKL
jgi:hypothetical protein